MIVLLNTASSTCYVTLVNGEQRTSYQWEAHRTLARELLGKLDGWLQEQGSDIQSLSGLGVMKGPGSFTGLRIGLAVANTLADGLHIPIVGMTGDDWQERALARLQNGENDQIVLPEYGSEAHITKPRK